MRGARPRPGEPARDRQRRACRSRNADYVDYLYERLQRHGFLRATCQRLINQDRNHFAACMVALGDADGMVTGVTRNFGRRWRRCCGASIRARRPGHRRVARAGARPHRVRRRHRGHRDAGRRRPRRDRHRGGARRARARLRAAGRAARLLDLRPSAGRALAAGARGGAAARRAARRLRIRRRDAADVALEPELRDDYPFCACPGRPMC